MSSTIYDDNYTALLVSIFKEVCLNTAIEMLNTGIRKITSYDILEMVRLKNTMTYKQIGTIYNVTDNDIFNHIARYKRVQEAKEMALKGSKEIIIKPTILYRKPSIKAYSEKTITIDGKEIKAWTNYMRIVYRHGETTRAMTWYQILHTYETEFETFNFEPATGKRGD